MLPKSSESPPQVDHWTLIRDAAVLQFKLVVDGLRDLILVPLSLIAAVISLVKSENGKPGPHFYRLLRAGKRSERWIDLFGAYRRFQRHPEADEFAADMSIDDIVGRMESFVVDEYKRGGLTAQAKARIDQALRAVQGMHASKRRGKEDQEN